ncbi:hypothetical protein MTE01_11720 [Microbacterium testaceum]|uniref:Uncharacterized protein n=1 Tax=Microbacterium testaceum TaxID=2033 RepID=A0A4Y3QK05_MICTE|nr:hypothetical protein MTE01_11720 [Microbacterium testaceum]
MGVGPQSLTGREGDRQPYAQRRNRTPVEEREHRGDADGRGGAQRRGAAAPSGERRHSRTLERAARDPLNPQRGRTTTG